MISKIFENENYIVVNKPSGVLSVPSRLGIRETRPVLGIELEKELEVRLFPVHRLDFEVSGAILFAKNKLAHQIANDSFLHKKVKKTYQALTKRNPQFQAGESMLWTSKLVRGKKRTFEADYGKDSITQAQVLAFNSVHMHWGLEPITGRSHQLRFELSKRGCAILGDRLYGGDPIEVPNTILLQSISISHSDPNLIKLGLPQKILCPINFDLVKYLESH